MRTALMRQFYKMKHVWIINPVFNVEDVLQYICSFIFSFQHLPFFWTHSREAWRRV